MGPGAFLINKIFCVDKKRHFFYKDQKGIFAGPLKYFSLNMNIRGTKNSLIVSG